MGSGVYEHSALSAIKTDCQAQLHTITWVNCLVSVIVLAAKSTFYRFMNLHCISVTVSRYRLAALRSCLSKITVYVGASLTTCCLISTTTESQFGSESKKTGLFFVRQMNLTHVDV